MAGFPARRQLAMAVGATLGFGVIATAAASQAGRTLAGNDDGHRVTMKASARPRPESSQLPARRAAGAAHRRQVAVAPPTARHTIAEVGALRFVAAGPLVRRESYEHLPPLRLLDAPFPPALRLADPVPPRPIRVPDVPIAIEGLPGDVDPVPVEPGLPVEVTAPDDAAPAVDAAPVDVDVAVPGDVAVVADAAAEGDVATIVIESRNSAPTVIGSLKGAASVTGAADPSALVDRSDGSRAPVVAGVRGEYVMTYESVGGTISTLIDPSVEKVFLSDVSPANGWTSSIKRNDGKVKVVMTSAQGTVTFSIQFSAHRLVEDVTFVPTQPPPPPDCDPGDDDDDGGCPPPSGGGGSDDDHDDDDGDHDDDDDDDDGDHDDDDDDDHDDDHDDD